MLTRSNPSHPVTNSGQMQPGNRNAQKHNVYAKGEIIIARLRAGDFFTVACRYAQVSVTTAKRWRQLGRGGLGYRADNHICREEHVWFYEEVELALAEVEGLAVDCWMNEVKRGNWQAARDFLARRFPERWGRSERRALRVRTKPPAEIQLTWDDDDQPGYDGENAHNTYDVEE